MAGINSKVEQGRLSPHPPSRAAYSSSSPQPVEQCEKQLDKDEYKSEETNEHKKPQDSVSDWHERFEMDNRRLQERIKGKGFDFQPWNVMKELWNLMKEHHGKPRQEKLDSSTGQNTTTGQTTTTDV